VQLIILVLSIVVGLALAIIQWAGTFSVDVAVKGSQIETKEQSRKLFKNRSTEK